MDNEQYVKLELEAHKTGAPHILMVLRNYYTLESPTLDCMGLDNVLLGV